MTQSKKDGSTNQHTLRQVWEITMLIVSLLVILTLAGYLIYEGLSTQSKATPVEIRVQQAKPLSSQRGGGGGSGGAGSGGGTGKPQAVVPIEIHNRGDHTLRSLKVEIQRGSEQPFEVSINYLVEKSSHTLYVFVTRPDQKITAKPLSYSLE